MSDKPRMVWHRADPGVLVIEDVPSRERYAVLRHTGISEWDVDRTCNVCGDLLDEGSTTCSRGPWSVVVQHAEGDKHDHDDWTWFIDEELCVGFGTAREAKVWAESQVFA